jgi:uncharacterized FAD-dependent dehydrogenase
MSCQQEINDTLTYLSKLLGHYFDPSFNILNDTTRYQSKCNKKYYFSAEYFKYDFARIVKLLTFRIESKLVEKQNVCSITKNNDIYFVKTTLGLIFKARHIVLGTGRASYSSLPDMLEPFGAKFTQQIQDIGIRIEANSDCFTDTYYYQADPKIKLDFGKSGSSRTFCAHNRGKVVPVRFGKSFFADGAFCSEPTSKNNIAIMARTSKPLSNDVMENWMLTINELAGNMLLLGNAVLDDDFINNFSQLMPVFPTREHCEIMTQTLRSLLYGEDAIIVKGTTISIYSPSIDLQWLKPHLKSDFSLYNDNNIYVIGDAAGKSRGIIQALFAGVCWANKYVSKIRRLKRSYYIILNWPSSVVRPLDVKDD